MSAPAGNLGGRWDVNVKFLSSVSQHMFTRQQDGNKVQGSHKGDLSVRDIFGTIDSDQVKLRSAERVPGDQIIYTFAGTLSGDTISGEVYMGEYLNAKFTARPHTYPSETGAIVIPGGPPLAN